jgi:hypothetical protein
LGQALDLLLLEAGKAMQPKAKPVKSKIESPKTEKAKLSPPELREAIKTGQYTVEQMTSIQRRQRASLARGLNNGIAVAALQCYSCNKKANRVVNPESSIAFMQEHEGHNTWVTLKYNPR